MSRHELGELEKRWGMEREAGQGERNIKKVQAEVESLWKKRTRKDGCRKGAGE